MAPRKDSCFYPPRLAKQKLKREGDRNRMVLARDYVRVALRQARREGAKAGAARAEAQYVPQLGVARVKLHKAQVTLKTVTVGRDQSCRLASDYLRKKTHLESEVAWLKAENARLHGLVKKEKGKNKDLRAWIDVFWKAVKRNATKKTFGWLHNLWVRGEKPSFGWQNCGLSNC